MNILKIYRLTMLLIILLLILTATIIAYDNNQSVPENNSGKILVSRW